MNISILLNYLKERKITQEEFASKCGVTRPTLKLAIDKGDLKVSLLEKIAETMGISVCSFFDEECKDTESKKIIGDGNHVITVSGSNNINSSASAELKECKKELEYFKILLQEKDARIEELKEMVEYLKGK